MGERRSDGGSTGGARCDVDLLMVRGQPRQPAITPEDLLVDALLRLDALRAALSAGDVAILISVARRLKDRGARHGASQFSALLAQIVRAATAGNLETIGELLDQADREVARLDAETQERPASAC